MFADRLIFVPHRASYRDDSEIIKLTSSDGKKISAVHLPNKNARAVLLFSHGNAEDIGDLRPFLRELHQFGFGVFAYDYHGYGTSEGVANEKNVYADIDAAYDHLTNALGVAPERIIVHGRSVGSGPSVDLAIRKPVGGLILESPFTSAFRVVTRARLLPFDKFDNLAKIARVRCPVLVIHGTDDGVIAPWHGRKLFAAAGEPKRFVSIEGAGHNDLFIVAGDRYGAELQDFATALALGRVPPR